MTGNTENQEGDGRKLTPMMKQYLEMKEAYPDAILFFRLGDFYEMFFDDALEASRILQITLTARNKGGAAKAPMCGVPYHAADSYISKLTKNGKKVAICEQLSDPNLPGIVKRDVVRVVTPGTTLDDNILEGKVNNYVMAMTLHGGAISLAYADFTTGEFQTTEVRSESDLRSEVEKVRPAEVVIEKSFFGDPLFEKIRKDFEKIFFYEFEGGDEDASSLLMKYLKNTQKTDLKHVGAAKTYAADEFMPLDEATLKNLELLFTLREGKKEGSLLWVLDKTGTSMGGRLLRYFLTHPLTNKGHIDERLEAVEELTGKQNLHADLKELLKSVMDLERLLARLSMGRGNARDLVGLKNSLMQVPLIQGMLKEVETKLLTQVREEIDPLEDLVELIGRAIVDDPPVSMSDGKMIAEGYNRELDDLKKISSEGKQYIQNLQTEESNKTGITNLKVRYNKVFGYYIEVSKGQINKVPETYIRKQTLVNAERYITPELKEFEEKILGAEEKIIALEQKTFGEVREHVVENIERIQRTARYLALLDVLCSFASVTLENHYCKPVILDTGFIEITEGRHPVVERMSSDARFVPNDAVMKQDGERLLLITGPNMGGKSTYLRQVALIVLMAQIGSFVPAASAKIGLVDRIFTRVGASDNLVKGQSTFMVEMEETSNILKNATENSLVILDEVGRGTSTYDGMSIAWAISEYLHDKVKAKTLFATHYHELISLADKLQHAANYAVQVSENEEDGVVFLYKVLPGGVDRSYGIEVAKLAGLPEEVVSRANQILVDLEEGVHEKRIQKELESRPAATQEALFEDTDRESGALKKKITEIDLDSMTPIEALNKLAELKSDSN
jgi:DNA mismatch repair protein MutS